MVAVQWRPLRSLVVRLAALTAGASALAGCISHPGPDRVEALRDGWTALEKGRWVARSDTVRVAAFHKIMAERCVFGGSVTNLAPEAVRVSIRPAEFGVSGDTVVGLRPDWAGGLTGTAIRSGEEIVVPPREGGSDEAHVFRFGLRPTSGPEGDVSEPRPYSEGDVVAHWTTSGGVERWEAARAPRTGDVAHYTITVAGPAGDESWDFHFRTVPGPEIRDVEWYTWLALPLLPLYLVLNWCGAVD
jgi:hypothetical protein